MPSERPDRQTAGRLGQGVRRAGAEQVRSSRTGRQTRRRAGETSLHPPHNTSVSFLRRERFIRGLSNNALEIRRGLRYQRSKSASPPDGNVAVTRPAGGADTGRLDVIITQSSGGSWHREAVTFNGASRVSVQFMRVRSFFTLFVVHRYKKFTTF